jgi:hypothetical protein
MVVLVRSESVSKPRTSTVPIYESTGLIAWAEDKSGAGVEVDALGKVFRNYGFETEKYFIPSAKPQLKLTMKAGIFLETHDSEDCLMIVYYAGHAYVNQQRQSIWSL